MSSGSSDMERPISKSATSSAIELIAASCWRAVGPPARIGACRAAFSPSKPHGQRYAERTRLDRMEHLAACSRTRWRQPIGVEVVYIVGFRIEKIEDV